MRIAANGLSFEVDDQGLPGGEPLLLIMGLGMQLVAWPEPFVQQLVARGFRVIRLDNRDIGLSQHLDHLGMPNMPLAMLRWAMHLPVRSPYALADMAADAVAVVDALGLPSVHVCGASMGGMIAQHVAARHPERVRSLTLMMTTSGARHLPRATRRVQRALLQRPDGRHRDDVLNHLERLWGLIGSPEHRPTPEQLRTRLSGFVERSWHPAGAARQLLAIVADGDRTPLLGRIRTPTHVIHGRADPLVPPQGGEHLARHIAGATLDLVPGMGHDLPEPLLPRFVDGITTVARRVT
jgi:pimeloyl-ACP methyl ester carboxylesterase